MKPAFHRCMRSLVSWQVPRRAALDAYRNALIHSDLKRVEVGLSYLLWGCVVLMSSLVWPAGYHFWFGGGDGLAAKRPAGLSQSVSGFNPPQVHVLANIALSNQLPSLFRFKPVDAHPPAAVSLPAPETPMMVQPIAKPAAQPLHLALHIQTLPQLHASLKPALNIAVQQLLSGQLAQASDSFERVLQQDPHQVIALAGMLVVTSQRGEIQQREDYLSRIRSEIPDYVPDDDLFLMQLEE